jgi:hypothetical protein
MKIVSLTPTTANKQYDQDSQGSQPHPKSFRCEVVPHERHEPISSMAENHDHQADVNRLDKMVLHPHDHGICFVSHCIIKMHKEHMGRNQDQQIGAGDPLKFPPQEFSVAQIVDATPYAKAKIV